MEIFYRNLPELILFENVSLMHYNARPHRSIQTEAYLENKNVRLLRQQSYSTDCNIFDFYIFPRLQEREILVTRRTLRVFLMFSYRFLPVKK